MANRLRRVSVATVWLWGIEAGAVAWNEERMIGSFEYTNEFIRHELEVAPLTMPLRTGVFTFPGLRRETFYGLPGLLADSLPDRFGNRLIDLWLQQRGRSVADFSPVERLCYMGARGMGALEFKPALTRQPNNVAPIEVAELTELAREILANRAELIVHLQGAKAEALNTIIRVGTSAGGARAKAVIAWNRKTNEVRSGQVPVPPGFEPWILKLDGANEQTLGEPQGFGRIEYAYHKMAVAAGIEMNECRLLVEGDRAHFMTRRFDRDLDGVKIHMQSLCALGHYDFNTSREYGYEQAFSIIQQLNLGAETMTEMFRRMVFNVLARNQDDHTRNIAFLMNRKGRWRLSPAFDVLWSHNPGGKWTNQHQMRINGKTDNFALSDLLAVAHQFGIRNALDMIEQVGDSVTRWRVFAKEAGVPLTETNLIGKTHRLHLIATK
ncbi:MAG: type II toxin-antitoxin system HipA family toxin [Candidatus Omnitrophota bacterium]